ncbi:serine/threonine-protein kinase [Nocardia mangyaensis]|uniref:serine/threonine-protein kinase n=1 Tax=Nocardia mangyaensis TaxID=2213200 RepID=UPI002676EFC9|nr:serine/threonine-protein kinase [Nocardia mangyaensis]MDO3645421.1 serine/threonine-protein kinase [Nocardia mangyaensis]
MIDEGGVFAGYTIERLLGRGGMGSVYLARHPRLPRRTAMKLLNRELFFDTEIRARFEREADLVARLEHPNIVTVYDRGVENDQLWISMRYIDGSDASSLPVPVDPARAVRIVAETGAALDFAHSRGVLHRDVKPANILIEPIEGGERVYLTDFGIARLHDDSSAKLTQTGTFTATLAFASPEQLSGVTLDGRADQYSLACTLYRLLTGTTPFEAPNPVAVIQGHLQQPPPRASIARPGLPAALDAVLARAMAKRPEDRFGSCAEFTAAAAQALTDSAAPQSFPGTPVTMTYPPNSPYTPAPGYPMAGMAPFASYSNLTPAPNALRPRDTSTPRTAGERSAVAEAYLGPKRGSRWQGSPVSWAAFILLLGLVGWLIVNQFTGPAEGSSAQGGQESSAVPATSAAQPPSTTTTVPTTDRQTIGAHAAKLSDQFPRMLPHTTADTLVHAGSGLGGAGCFAYDRATANRDSEDADMGGWLVMWRCFGGGNRATYEFFLYPSADAAARAISGLPANDERPAVHNGRDYTNFVLHNSQTRSPRMVTRFDADPARAAMLMYSRGFIATENQLFDWWHAAPLD